jgi:hypothetical protein
MTNGPVAQLAEQQPFKLWVQGSIPCRLTEQASDPSLVLSVVEGREELPDSQSDANRAGLPHETASEGTRPLPTSLRLRQGRGGEDA